MEEGDFRMNEQSRQQKIDLTKGITHHLRIAVVFVVLCAMGGCDAQPEWISLNSFAHVVQADRSPVESTTPENGKCWSLPSSVCLVRVDGSQETVRRLNWEVEAARERGAGDFKTEHERALYRQTNQQFSIIAESSSERDKQALEQFSSPVRLVLASSVIQLPIETTAANVVRDIRAAQTDWLVVFALSSDVSIAPSPPIVLLQLFTLGLAPTMAEAEGRLSMYVFDLRTNCLVQARDLKDVGGQPAIGWTRGAAGEQTGQRLERRGFAAMLDRLSILASGGDPDAKRPVDATKAWADQ
jgi:hypothetical protein